MAGPRKGAGTVLLILGILLVVIVAAWDMSHQDSILRGLFNSNRDPGSAARSIIDGVRQH